MLKFSMEGGQKNGINFTQALVGQGQKIHQIPVLYISILQATEYATHCRPYWFVLFPFIVSKHYRSDAVASYLIKI